MGSPRYSVLSKIRRKDTPINKSERSKTIRRAIASYLDLSINRSEWESRYPADIQREAREAMTLEQLRCRG